MGEEEGGERRPFESRQFAHGDPNFRIVTAEWRVGIQDLEAMRFAGQGVWKQVGPEPLRVRGEQAFSGQGPNSGEIVDISIDQTGGDAPTIYAAAGSGGLWKSTDGGQTWRPLTDGLGSTSIGAVGIDPGNSDTIYIGTGNAFEGANNINKGLGLFKSVDGGESWAPLDGGPNATQFADHPVIRLVCPAPDVLLVATDRGLFLSMNGGRTFGANAPQYDDGEAVRAGFVSALALDNAASTIRRVEANENDAGTNRLLVPDHGFENGDRVWVGGPRRMVLNGSFIVGNKTNDRVTIVGSAATGTGPVEAMIIGPTHARTTAITGATNPAGAATPIVITAVNHQLITGDVVAVYGVQGNTNANRSWQIRVLTADTFELVGSHGNAAYIAGGAVDGPRHGPAIAITGTAPHGATATDITAAGHGLIDGDRVSVDGLTGVAAPNNSGVVTVTGPDTFRIDGVHVTGAFVGPASFTGPSAQWNSAYFAISGRQPPNSAANVPTRGLFRFTLCADRTFVISDNLLAHPGGPADPFARVVFAQSALQDGRPRARTLYAGAQRGEGAGAVFVGLFRSTDFGATWSGTPSVQLRNATQGPNGSAGLDGFGQSAYDFTLGVDPQVPTRIYVAFQQLYFSVDGVHWPPVPFFDGGGDLTDAVAVTDGRAASAGHLHYDHHELVFMPATHWRFDGAGQPAQPTSLYCGTDGGIARSDDGGTVFEHLNQGLATSLLIGIDIGRGAGNNAVTFGGMQDTGTAGRRTADAARWWTDGIDGDGDVLAVDPEDPEIVYGFDNRSFMITVNGGERWFSKDDHIIPLITAIHGTNPVRIETTGHVLRNGDPVTMAGVRDAAGALVGAVNGARTIRVIDKRELTLDGVNGAALAFEMPRANGNRYLRAVRILHVGDSTPLEVLTEDDHGFNDGQGVRIEGVVGIPEANNTEANPFWTVTRTGARTFTLDTSAGLGVRVNVAGTGRVLGPRQAGDVTIQRVTNAAAPAAGAVARDVVITAPGHGFASGEQVTIAGLVMTGAAHAASGINGPNQRIRVLDENSFELTGVIGNGALVAFPSLTGPQFATNVTTSPSTLRIAMAPGGTTLTRRIYVSIRHQLFRSDDSGRTFTLVHTFVESVSALAAPTHDDVWVGKFAIDNGAANLAGPGLVERSRNGGVDWLNLAHDHFVSRLPSRGSVFGFAVDPADANHVAVVMSGYSHNHPQRRTHHAVETTTGGFNDLGADAWTEIGGVVGRATGNLPDLPLFGAVFEVNPTGEPPGSSLLVASDGGVLRRVGDAWVRVGPNLPTASCQSIVVDHSVAPNVIRVGTYGRSAWELDRPAGPVVIVRGALGFGECQIGRTKSLPVVLYNAGGATATVTNISFITGSGFTAMRAGSPPTAITFPFDIAPGAADELIVTFAPVAAVTHKTSMGVSYNSATTLPAIAPVSGVGITPAAAHGNMSVQGFLDFGLTTVGAPVTLPLVIRNTGSGDLQFNSIVFDVPGNAAFSLPAPPAAQVIAAGASITVDVRFQPAAAGAIQRALAIDFDQVPAVAGILVLPTITVRGEGIAAGANIFVAVMQFFGLADQPDEALV